MKRAVACLLAICLTLQGPAGFMTGNAAFGQSREATPSNGTPASASNAQKENGVSGGGTAGQLEAELKELGEEADTGEVKLEIRGVLPVQEATNWDVFLTKKAGDTDEGAGAIDAIQMAGTDSSERYTSGTCTFTNLPGGTYELLVKNTDGKGYLDYKQNVSVNSDRVSILLLNDYPDKYGYSGKKLPGVIKMGDINGDGKIDDRDLKELIDEIDQSSSGRSDDIYDLNGDGEVNLVDLQYFTIFYKNKSNTEAAVTRQTVVNAENIVASSSNASVDPEIIKEVFSGKKNSDEDTTLTLHAEKPLSEKPIEITAELTEPVQSEGFTIEPAVGSAASIRDGKVTVAYIENGKEETASFIINDGVAVRTGNQMQRAALVSAKEDSLIGKTIVINLGKEVAIKRVTIRVDSTLTEDAMLVEISKVEFLNDMESRIPEPAMNIPENLAAQADSESFDLTWKRAVNVTGYEVKVSGKVKGGVKTVYFPVEKNSLTVESLENEDLINGEEYTVRVQAVNGAWKSGYSAAIKVTPEAAGVPDPPDGISVKAGYRSLEVTWKKMKNTDRYSLYYREYQDTDGEYIKIENIENESHLIEKLKDETKYDIYLTGTNKKGESAPSPHYTGTTESIDPPVTPNYKLINVPEEQGGTAHIKAVNNHGGDADSEFAVADNDFRSAWVRKDWDAGCVYPGEGKSPIVTFDDAYTMDTIVIVPDQSQPYTYPQATLFYWPEGSTKSVQADGRLSQKKSANNKIYYEFQTTEPFTADRVQVRLTTGYGSAYRISIAEMKFYDYDPLEHDIYDLFADDMHISLKEWVQQSNIDDLGARLERTDEVSGEFHPKQSILKEELATAQKLFDDKSLAGVMAVDNSVTKKSDGHLGFQGGLNAWQPLGITAMTGDTVLVYVGSPSKKTGDSTSLKLIATQYHGESSAWSKDLGTLKAGVNAITIPKITDLDVEQGGQLYIEYTGVKGKENYSVRVSGGHRIPILDITKASDSNAARALVTEYVEEVENYTSTLAKQHNDLHGDGTGAWVADRQNCILGATDIVTRFTMFSVSSEQILAGLSGSTTEEKADQLYQSLQAADGMVSLFYQHKGLSDADGAGDKNRLPVSRLNLRYQRMFSGAFMYAGGLHIGIGWGSIRGLVTSSPIVTTADGKYESGRYFGWGIAHEIGHEINEGAYAIAEITNNYFSVLAQAHDTNDSVRFQYPEVYKKVTSGVTGRAANVFTQLGLYWQLHLAYDMGGYNYKTFDKYEDQFNNLFFARVDTYARDQSIAPSPGGVKLSLSGANVDNKLMRLACAAAGKNILEFFERWGMTPDDTTKKYAGQFEKETRAIWFVNDEARVYVMENGSNGSIAKNTAVSASLSYEENSNEVTIHLGNHAANADAMLGYEIYRSENIKGKTVRKPVGFVTVDSNSDETEYVDTISTINNRVFTYEVVGYDKYLNATPSVKLNPVKVSHGGVIDKSNWTVTTNMVSEEDQVNEEVNPDTVEQKAIEKVMDGQKDTTYTGKTVAGKAGTPLPVVTVHLNGEETITGLVYTLNGAGTPIGRYNIEISDTGEEGSWTSVKTGVFDVTGGSQTVYFNKEDDTWLYAYDTSYVRITALNQKGTDLSISEIDLLGQTGDNIDFAQTDSIGILKEDYHAGQGESGSTAIIPKGSLIFTGTYKGNPAYNTVLLYDENGTIVGGRDKDGNIMAAQMIFAETPAHGELGETSKGTWIYYIEPEYLTGNQHPGRVRAELYRVNDAHSNQGERLVSNTLFVNVPEVLPEIVIKADVQN